MGWTEQEYLSQRQAFINEISRQIKKEQDEIKKQNARMKRR